MDCIRLFALEQRIRETATIERIEALREQHPIVRLYADEIVHAFEFLMLLRIHHLYARTIEGVPDNFIDPNKLSLLEKRSLKEAFQLIAKLQDLLVELYEGAKEATPFYVNDGAGRFGLLPSGYGNVINNDFALVDVRGDGHRDFFTSDDSAFPKINHYVVRELGGPEPPGVPSSVSTPAIRVTTWPQSLCNCRPGGVSKRTVARLGRSARFGRM